MSSENNMDSKLHHDAHQDTLAQIKSAGSVAMPPELFEKLYLQPQTRVKGVLRQTLGNPTPMSVDP